MRLLFARIPLVIAACCVLSLPWFFGGVDGSTQFFLGLSLALAGLGVCLQVGHFAEACSAIRLPLIVLAAALLLGSLQLSRDFAHWLSGWDPAATAVVNDFAASAVIGEVAPALPLSLHPPSTRHQLSNLILGIAALVIGASAFSNGSRLTALLTCTTVAGAAVAFFGILQKLSWNGLIYWTFSSLRGMPFGPFINRNNAGGFLEIALAAAVGLLAGRVYRIPSLDGPMDESRGHGRRRRAGWRERWAWLLAHLDASLLFYTAAVFLIISGILASMSRGSFVSLLVATVVVTVVRTATSRVTALTWVPPLFIVAALGFLGWLGQSDSFYARVRTLLNSSSIEKEPRLAHWDVAWRASQAYQPFGSGLGTYRFAYTRLQEEPTELNFYYAENQFLDALLTGGYIGLALFICLWLLLVVAAVRLARASRSPADRGFAVAATFLTAAQTTHACFDFAMYLPAIYVPLALLSGAFMRRTADLTAVATEVPVASLNGRRNFLALLLGLSLCGGLVWSVWELRAGWISRSALIATRTPSDSPQLRDADWVENAIRIQRQAIAVRPDDGELRIRLAELLVARYGIAFRRELANFAVDPQVWQWESPNKLHADAHLLARIDDNAALTALRSNSLVIENLKPALAEARLARTLCPLAPYGHMLVAKLSFIDESPLDDLFYLDRAERLVGGRAEWLFEIGALHLDAARLDRCFAAWRRCWEISPANSRAIVRMASAYLTPEELLRKVVPANPEVMMHVAQAYFPDPDQEYARRVFYRAALELLAGKPHPTAKDCHQAARCAWELRDLSAAVGWYRRALDLDETHADWYFEAAQLHVQLADWKTAESLARQALRMSSDNDAYRKLLGQIESESVKKPSP